MYWFAGFIGQLGTNFMPINIWVIRYFSRPIAFVLFVRLSLWNAVTMRFCVLYLKDAVSYSYLKILRFQLLVLAFFVTNTVSGYELLIVGDNVQRAYNFVPVFFNNPREGIIGNYTSIPLVSQNASAEAMINAMVYVNDWRSPVESIMEKVLAGRSFLGVIVASTGKVPGNLRIETNGGPVKVFEGVPCLSIIEPYVSDLNALFAEDPNRQLYVTFTINGDEINPWDRGKDCIAGQVVLSILAVVGISFAAWRFILFVMARLFNVGFACTLLLLASLILKLAYVSVDPWGFHMIYSYATRSILSSLHVPWGFSCALLVALFWHETLTKDIGLSISGFLDKLRIPFFIFVGFMFALELVFITSRVLGYYWLEINVMLYLFLAAALASFYIISGIRILRALKKGTENMKSKSTREHRKRAACLVASVLGFYLFLLGGVLLGMTDLGYAPTGFALTVGLYCAGTILTDIAMAVAITPPSKEYISSNTRSSSTKKAKSATDISNV